MLPRKFIEKTRVRPLAAKMGDAAMRYIDALMRYVDTWRKCPYI